MKICHIHFDANKCDFKQDIGKPIEEQIRFCRNLRCPHGSIMERNLKDGNIVAFVSCDLTWNPFSGKPTTEEERELMMQREAKTTK